MLITLAIANYRSLLHLVMPLGRLNVITGPNATGKSNLYRALRLLAETAHGGVVQALAARIRRRRFRLCDRVRPAHPFLLSFFERSRNKRECIWAGPHYRPASALVDRQGPLIKTRST